MTAPVRRVWAVGDRPELPGLERVLALGSADEWVVDFMTGAEAAARGFDLTQPNAPDAIVWADRTQPPAALWDGLREDAVPPLVWIVDDARPEFRIQMVARGVSDVIASHECIAAVLRRSVVFAADAGALRRDTREQEQRLLDLAAQWAHDNAHDEVTGLPNRGFFERRVAQAHWNAADDIGGVVMLADVARFRFINDSLGHEAGDVVLEAVGRRLCKVVDPMATTACFGGDAFGVLLPTVRDSAALTAAGVAIRDAVAAPIEVDGHRIFPVLCMGAVFLDGQTAARDAIREAEIALHRAKQDGRGAMVVYSDGMQRDAVQALLLDGQLRGAVDGGELTVVYQPVVDIASGEVVAAEALSRWHHPVLGAVPPDEFIRVAEDAGLVTDVGNRVLRAASAAAVRLNADREQPIRIYVNISPRHLVHVEFLADFKSILADAGCDASWIGVEITESVLIESELEAYAAIETLRAWDIPVSIDDFGTGYSSLSYLTRFPLDTLKIDRAFIASMDRSPRDRELVRAVVGMAHNLGLEVVAEGIETQEQLEAVGDFGCDRAQGFLFGPGITEAEFVRYLGADAVVRAAA